MADLQAIREGFRGFGLRDRKIPFLAASLLVANATYPIKPGYPLIPSSGKITVAAVTGTNEVQRITVTGTPTGGLTTATITTPDAATGAIAIPYNATAAQVQVLVNALTNVHLGDIVVSGGPFPGTAIDFTFVNDLSATDITSMTLVDAYTGGSSPAAALTTPTAGVRGYITSTKLVGYANEWENGPISNWSRNFAQSPIELDLPFSGANGTATPDRELKFNPCNVGPDIVYAGSISPYIAVTQALAYNDYDLGWDVTRKELYIRPDGTTSNTLARVVEVPREQIGVVGGWVYFVTLSADSYYTA